MPIASNSYGRTSFDEQTWREENGNVSLSSDCEYFCKQAAVYKINALNKLKDLANGRYHVHQMAAAVDATHELLDSPSLEKGEASLGVILNGLTQSGKTGVIQAMVDLFTWLFGPEMKNWPYNIIIISCPATLDLILQTSRRIAAPMGRASLQKTKVSAAKEAIARSGYSTEEEYLRSEKVYERWSATAGFEKCAYIPNRTIIVFDEADFGNAKDGVLDSVLRSNGINLSEPPTAWTKANIKLVFLSATNLAATIATRDQSHIKTVNMLAPKEYYGPHEQVQNGKIQAAWPLKSKQSRRDLAALIRRKYGDKSGYIIVRGPLTGSGTSAVIADELREELGDIAQVVELNQQTRKQARVQDLCQLEGSNYFSAQDGAFWKPPQGLVIVVLKNMLNRGVTICNDHMLLCFERVSATRLSNADFIAQSLSGRMSGYSPHCPDIFTDVRAHTEYIHWVNSGYTASSTPSKGSRVRSRQLRSYSSCAHISGVNMEDLSHEDQFLLRTSHSNELPKRRQTVLRLLKQHGHASVANRIAACSKFPTIYALPNWTGGSVKSRDVIRDSIQNSSGASASGVKGWFRKRAFVILVDWDDDANLTITVVEDTPPHITFTHVATKTMHQSPSA